MRGQSQSISVTEVHARHILLKPSPIMTDQQARLKLEQIAADIKSGKTTFAAAAKEFSQDHGSANGAAIWVGRQRIFSIQPSAMR